MLESPLSLVTYFSNLQNQMVFVTHKRIWKKFFGARPWRLKPVYGSTELRTLVWLQRAGEQSFEKYLRIPQFFFCFNMFSEVRKFYNTRDATVLHKLPFDGPWQGPAMLWLSPLVRQSICGVVVGLSKAFGDDWFGIGYFMGNFLGYLWNIFFGYFLDTFWTLLGYLRDNFGIL